METKPYGHGDGMQMQMQMVSAAKNGCERSKRKMWERRDCEREKGKVVCNVEKTIRRRACAIAATE